MDSLNLSDSGLKTLPDLSALSIKTIHAAWNSISVLWDGVFPADLEELNLEGNMITTDGLLTSWPHTIKVLNLSRNYFWRLDHVQDWPAQLRVLNLSRTEIVDLYCFTLPPSLEELDISHTGLTELVAFPPNLKTLVADFTGIKKFPRRCPDTLERFSFSSTRVPVAKNCLPTYWGTSLKKIDMTFNKLLRIPNSLPETLEYANFANNEIQEIPPVEKFPPNVLLLHLGNNRIREVPSWFHLRPKMKFTIQNNCLTEIPKLSTCLIAAPQFVGENYSAAAKLIQRVWRRKKITPPVRTWKRMRILKYDLLAAAMCPERAGKFEDISPYWNYQYTGP